MEVAQKIQRQLVREETTAPMIWGGCQFYQESLWIEYYWCTCWCYCRSDEGEDSVDSLAFSSFFFPPCIGQHSVTQLVYNVSNGISTIAERCVDILLAAQRHRYR